MKTESPGLKGLSGLKGPLHTMPLVARTFPERACIIWVAVKEVDLSCHDRDIYQIVGTVG